MTTPNPAQSLLAAPRQLTAWVLVGYAGLHLIFSFLEWVVPQDFTTFALRSAASGFTSLVEVAMPLIAVLVAAAIAPPVPHARLIATVAVLEYLAILFFGAITYLIGFGGLGGADALDVLSYLAFGLARLALVAAGGIFAYQAWTKLGGSLAALTRPAPAPPTGQPPAV